MRTQRSAGFVIYKKEGRSISYLLLHHGSKYWNFPKGRLEQDEDDLTSARRELAEETGLTDIRILENYKDEYKYDFDVTIENGVKEKIYKTAVFYIAEVTDDKVEISDEHIDFGWFDYDTAFKRMFYQEGQDLLKKANKFILSQDDIVI